MKIFSFWKNIQCSSDHFFKISENQDSADVDPQDHSFTRTIDEEAEMEEQAERDREEGHPEPEDEEEDREHEVMTAGSEYTSYFTDTHHAILFGRGTDQRRERQKFLHFF